MVWLGWGVGGVGVERGGLGGLGWGGSGRQPPLTPLPAKPRFLFVFKENLVFTE